jgi:nucleoside 2-deoxyribosyltransferase
MGKCFVIQPFDKGRFDKRYADVFAPAISDTGLEPYRIDRDPSVSIPIEDIQAGIESCEACLAEISTDNPNVWFELGYAIASQREVVLICSEERTSHFPFDVQHRSIIKYSTESPQDFKKLQKQITARLKALLQRKTQLSQVSQMSSVAKLEGLEQWEIATLVAVAQQINDPSDGISAYRVREDMEKAGFTKLAATLGLKALLDKKMLETFQDNDYDGSKYTAYRVTDRGMSWLFANQNKLTLRQENTDNMPLPDDDDIPF